MYGINMLNCVTDTDGFYLNYLYRTANTSFDILEELPEKAQKQGPGRRGNLYQFNRKRYKELMKQGFYFEI